MNRREDVTPKMVADLWLSGLSMVAIATELDIAMETARKRLAKAKELHPDLPWEERKPKMTRSVASDYARMNDGKTGRADLRAGSIVNSSRLRRRG
jgi:orotate phosphoribosyltransferase-like protein